jgi:outer membrane lipoprotein-sorting protein
LFIMYLHHSKKIKMKLLKHCLLLLTASAGIIAVQAQTADDIINKHIEAVGGKDKLSQVNSVYMESTISAMGNDGPSTINIVNGKGFRLESEINGQKIIQVYTDKSGWAVNPFAGGTDAQPMPNDQYKAGRDQIDVGGPLFNYASKGSKVELLGQEDSAYKIKLTSKDSVVTTFYIDPATYYIKKSVQTLNMMGQDMEVTRTSSDFRKTDFGIVNPYTVDISYGGQFSITSTLKKIEFNKTIDPKIFDMPK